MTNGNDISSKVVWFVLGLFLMGILQIAWHGVTVAYAQKDRITAIETALPRIEQNMKDGFCRLEKLIMEHSDETKRTN